MGLLTVHGFETDFNETSTPETAISAEKAFCEGKCDPSTNTECVVIYGRVLTYGSDVIKFIGGYTCQCKSDFELNAAGQCIAIVNSTTRGPVSHDTTVSHGTTVSTSTADIHGDSKRIDNHMHVLKFLLFGNPNTLTMLEEPVLAYQQYSQRIKCTWFQHA